MAELRLCSVSDCGKPAKTRGWCKSHYRRWYAYGDPTAGGTYKGDLARYYTSTVLACESDKCLIWPFSKAGRGYGLMTKGGVRDYVHIFACADTHGPKPTPYHEVAHSCGNGHLGCVNPNHLRWASRAENHADKLHHHTDNRGAKHGNAKLTSADVLAIRALKGVMSARIVGSQFGVSRSTVTDIMSGKRWAWLKG